MTGRNADIVESTVKEIVASVGDACASVGDVADRAYAEQLVVETVERHGQLDILVNDAGVIGYGMFADLAPGDFWHVMDVNLGGAVNVTRAAWPHMVSRGYGRVLRLPSQGMYGAVMVSHYSASKAALFGLMRSLSHEGVAVGINVNAVIPFAFTSMMEDVIASGSQAESDGAEVYGLDAATFAPEFAAPAISWLAHEDCTVTGEMMHAGGGRVAKVFLAETPGFVQPGHTIETVRDRWKEATAEAGYRVPESVTDTLGNVIESVLRHRAEQNP